MIIAITGGIGTGKSTAIATIKQMGYHVISADDTYNELLKNPDFVRGVHRAVGIKNDSDTLDRVAVSSAVFNEPSKLKALNEFTHAKIYEKMFEKSKNYPVSFHEVPLLFESGYQDKYQNVIVIMRDLGLRIKSVENRSGLTSEEVLSRIKNQYDYENLDKNKHTVITNDGSLQEFSSKVKAVVNEILG